MRPTLDGFDRVVTMPLFALYTGWLAAAAWLNTGSVLKLLGIVPPTFSPVIYAALLLLAIAALSLVLLRRAHGYLWLGLTTVWALGGVAHANIYLRPNSEIAMLAIGLALIIVAMLIWQRRPIQKSEYSA